jgi:hypothetical protein
MQKWSTQIVAALSSVIRCLNFFNHAEDTRRWTEAVATKVQRW